MGAIVFGGRTFSVYCDRIDVTRLNRPDETWVYVDPNGHEHFWLFDGVRGRYSPSATADVPSIVFVKTGEEYWEDDDEPHDVGHYECRECGAVVEPRTKADDTRQYIAGLKHYSVDGEAVSREAFIQMAKDTGLPTDQL